MNIKPRIAIPIMLVLLTAVGLHRIKAAGVRRAIERATSVEPTLTSTALPAAPEPVAKHKEV